MSKVILHIGTHKTGSTSLQNSFWTNSDLLAGQGVHYPRLPGSTGHHGMVLDWAGRPDSYALPQGALGTLGALAEQHAQQDHILFLSSEEFARDDALQRMVDIRDTLAAFDDIQVVCVLRTQWEFLQSVYPEVSKIQNPGEPEHLVTEVLETGAHNGLWFDYNRLLDRLEEVFLPEQIQLLDFDSCRRKEGGVVGAVLDLIGAPLHVHQLKPVDGGWSNPSPMALAGWAANVLYAPYAAPSWLVSLATDVLRSEFGSKVQTCLFTRKEFYALKTHFQSRNAELVQRRSALQPEFDLTPVRADQLTLFRDDITQMFWVHLGRRLLEDHSSEAEMSS